MCDSFTKMIGWGGGPRFWRVGNPVHQPGQRALIRLSWALVAAWVWGGLSLALFGQDWEAGPGLRWRELPRPVSNGVGFRLLPPETTGLRFTNVLAEADGAANRTLYNGSGVAAGDFDGDGLPDLVFAGLSQPPRLFRNLGGWRFSDVTAQSGVALSNFIGRGVVLADVTGDGLPELLATGNGAGVRAWRNTGQGRFAEMTREAGLASSSGGMTMALADADGNGTLDLYLANNRTDDIRDQGSVQLRLVRGRPMVPAALTNRLVIAEGQVLEYGEPDQLYLNKGGGVFEAVKWGGGRFRDEAGNVLGGPPLDWGLSVTFRDFNNDLAPDLYVCNDFWTPDRIWLNDGRGNFRMAPALAFRQTSGSSMGVDLAWLNDDEHPEIFVADMLSRLPAWRKRQRHAQAPFLNWPGQITNRPQSLRNTLFLARGDGTYAEIANYAGLSAAEWAWQPVFLDIDLDGHPDLLVTSGHARDVQDRDAEREVRARQRNYGAIANPAERRRVFLADLQANMQLYPPLRTPVLAFRQMIARISDIPGFASRFQKQTFSFPNSKPYKQNRWVVTAAATKPNGCCMQIAEVELLGVVLPGDVTQAGDPVTASSANSPGSEGVANAIDGQPTKYLNFDSGRDGAAQGFSPSGFVATSSIGATTAIGLAMQSANDAPERDPKRVTLEGSNDETITAFNSGSWELIATISDIPAFTARFQTKEFFFPNTKSFRPWCINSRTFGQEEFGSKARRSRGSVS